MGKLKGEVTVFLSLIMVVMLGFVGALIQSSKYNMDKVYQRNQVEMATESVFAEYHRTLFKEFHIFALEATYEAGQYQMENIRDRLLFYGANHVNWEITQQQQLSDCNGATLEEQIITYMKQKYGITKLQYLLGESSNWELQREEGEAVVQQLQENEVELEQQVVDQEGSLAEAGNPLPQLSQARAGGILNLVMADRNSISDGQVELTELPSHRTLQTGIHSYEVSQEHNAMSKILLVEYALEHFHAAVNQQSDSDLAKTNSTNINQANMNSVNTDAVDGVEGLSYEIEYLLEGHSSDRENLKAVLNKVLMMRVGINYACLMKSPTKRAEASAMALTIATASTLPVLQPIVEQALLLGWAYGESIVDLRGLMKGGRIPIMKTDANWQLGIQGLFQLGTESDQQDGANNQEGLCYKDYLRMLLYMENKDRLLMRQMDMIEQRLRYVEQLSYFRIDYCLTQLQFTNTSYLMGGFTYEYPVAFTYR